MLHESSGNRNTDSAQCKHVILNACLPQAHQVRYEGLIFLSATYIHYGAKRINSSNYSINIQINLNPWGLLIFQHLLPNKLFGNTVCFASTIYGI